MILTFVQEIDPYLLDIGPGGRVTVSSGYFRTTDGKATSPAGIAKSAKGVRFVFVGESHNNPDHHRAQADVIRALADAGRDVCVGFEMFTRDNQENLNPYSLGWWSEQEFIERAEWKKQWGFKFEIYKPIFDVVREKGLPMAALNIPRDWVRQIGRQGKAGLTEQMKAWVPTLDTGNKTHRSVFDALIGGHPGTGADNMYTAQVSWDTGMATSALDFMSGSKNPNRVMVVVAGVGHMMYGQGINWRITEKTHERVVNVACIDVENQREVSRGLGDFVFAAPPGKD